MKFSFGRLVLAVLALAAAGLTVYGFLPKPQEVEVAPVARGPLVVTVDHEGKTRIKERYVISAPLAGRLLRVELHAGDAVEAESGLVAAIEPTDPELLDVRARAQAEARVKAAEAATKRATANLEQARATYEFASSELQRGSRLLESNAIARQEYDDMMLRSRIAADGLRAAEFSERIAEFELEQAQAALLRSLPQPHEQAANSRFEIYSPITGRVLRVLQESAAVVTPGMPLLEIGDPANLEVEIDVLSTDAVQIKPGAKVWLEHWGGEEPLLARVRLVEPAAFTKISALGVEEQRVWVIADFADEPEKWRRLGDAYRVEARVVVWEADDVLKVPAGALFRDGGGWAVFGAQAGRARLRPVQIGKNNGMEAEVLDGLVAGDQVIVHPGDRIHDGVSVRWR